MAGRWRVLVATLLLFACLRIDTLSAQAFDANAVVMRAAQYVSGFVSRFTRIVAEERYVQELRTRSRGLALSVEHRELRADFLLVKTNASSGWMAFRDVFEVDQSQVHDRGDRLVKLFLQSPADAVTGARSISNESARYNLGPHRTVNNPVMVLAFLQDAYRPRFSFSIDGPTVLDGSEAVIVKYKEVQRPTLLRNKWDEEVPVEGRLWIERSTGSVLRTQLVANDDGQRSSVEVTFHVDPRLKLRVPSEMEEDYLLEDGTTIAAVAKYSRFREFQVTTDERRR
jgi:hypothetical protein